VGELTDQAWGQLAPLVPRNQRRGDRWRDQRTVINGILWKLRTGAPWRDLSERYGPWTTCYDRLVRWRFRYASHKDCAQLAKDLKPVSTPHGGGRVGSAGDLRRGLGDPLPSHRAAVEHAWAEFVPFLAFDLEIRTVITATNAIESLNARLRRSAKARGHFPTSRPRSSTCI
jgi:hypothetical protein